METKSDAEFIPVPLATAAYDNFRVWMDRHGIKRSGEWLSSSEYRSRQIFDSIVDEIHGKWPDGREITTIIVSPMKPISKIADVNVLMSKIRPSAGVDTMVISAIPIKQLIENQFIRHIPMAWLVMDMTTRTDAATYTVIDNIQKISLGEPNIINNISTLPFESPMSFWNNLKRGDCVIMESDAEDIGSSGHHHLVK
jgi:hypothetical protein